MDDDKELESFKRIINSIENVKIKMLPIAIEKPINEYADNELEDLNLTTVSDILTNTVMEENGKNIIEENRKEDNHKSIIPIYFKVTTYNIVLSIIVERVLQTFHD